MAHAQVRAWPEASGLGRLRDKAAAMARASSAYSSFRRSRQNSSVSLTTASKAGRMALGTDVGRSDLAMPDLVPGGAARGARSARGDGAGGRPGPRLRVADPLREAWIGSPPARLEGGLVAAVEADLAHERPLLAELGVAVAAGRVHLVGALPGEVDAVAPVAAVEAAIDRAEYELAATLPIERDVGGLDQVEEVGVPQRHLDDPPPAEQGMIAGGHQDLAGSSAGLARTAVRSGMARRRELVGLPGPRHQPLELVRLGPARDHALEHVGEPGQRLDPVELRGRHQARHDRPVAGPAIGPGEQGVLASQADRTDRPLDDVRIELEPAVLEEQL